MTRRLHYGTTSKVLHWLVVALLVTQYLIGWFMPDIRRGMTPGVAMTWHISIGTVILTLIAARLLWRLAHPVAPESSLATWQRVTSEGVHWLLYALVLSTTVSGWLFASMRGWKISWFFMAPFPMLTNPESPIAGTVGRWHESLEWALLIVLGIHVAAAFLHLFYYRDRVMQRMLPGL